jgi:hypothetical protein
MALVVVLAACQKEQEKMDVIVGGEVDMVVNVNVPNNTRAGSEKGIFESGILESSDTTMRYTLQVFYTDEDNNTHKTEPQRKYDDSNSVAFDVRLTPNRDYTFVVWADVVDGIGAGDKHYITTDLTNITVNTDTWCAMDETRDAFTAKLPVKDFTSSSIINLNLHRPNAKLRVKATDITATTTMPSSAKVTYTTQHRTAFNAYYGTPAEASATEVVHEYVIANIYNESDTERTLFSDYFFASEDGEKVTFEIELKNGNDTMKSLEFSDISIKRNHLTTIEGNMLSSGNVDNTSSVTEN